MTRVFDSVRDLPVIRAIPTGMVDHFLREKGGKFHFLFFIFPLIQLIYGGKPISDSQEDELVFLQGVWRHGDRSPTRTFKTDPYQESSWPQGFGQLSAVGFQSFICN